MRRIWTVAINTVRQALRMRVAVIFTVLLLILLPVMGLTATGDGTVKGRCQTFVSYGLSLTSMLLCLLTIIVSIYALSSDIKQRQIYTVLTKPIRRHELILGKLLGVIVLDFLLLTVFCGIIYGITVYMPTYFKADAFTTEQLDNEFFTARASLKPATPDVSKEVQETYEKLVRNNQLPEGSPRAKVMEWLEQQKLLEKRAAGPGEHILWEFNNVRTHDPNDSLFVRFKYEAASTPPNSQIYGGWGVGDYNTLMYRTPSQTPVFDRLLGHSVGTFHEFQVGAEVVPPDGHLGIGFLNPPMNGTSVIFPLEDGIELLYKADTFAANYVRAALMIFVRLVFLACLGTLASTFLSFPVAIMFCLLLFFVATFSGFVIESFSYLGENMSGVYSYTVKPVVSLLPQFDKYNPTRSLVPGRLISWASLGEAAGWMIAVKAPVLLLLGIFIFSRRELAKVTV